MIPESVLVRLREKEAECLEVSREEHDAMRPGDQISVPAGVYTVRETYFRIDRGEAEYAAVFNFHRAIV